MEKITSCHLSFFVVKHVSLFVTKSIFAPFHGFLCSAPSFCPFRDLFVCFMLLPFSHCEGLATLLWQMWQQKNKNTVVYARVRACVAYAPICARTNRSTSQKKEVASRARKLRRHGRQKTLLARVKGRYANEEEKVYGQMLGEVHGGLWILVPIHWKEKTNAMNNRSFANLSSHFNRNQKFIFTFPRFFHSLGRYEGIYI